MKDSSFRHYQFSTKSGTEKETEIFVEDAKLMLHSAMNVWSRYLQSFSIEKIRKGPNLIPQA